MLKILFSILLCFTTLYAEDTETLKKEIDKRFQNFSEDINAGKTKELSTYWTDDAQFTIPLTGKTLQGKDQINQFLDNTVKNFKDKNLHFTFLPGKSFFTKADEGTLEGVVEITDKDGKLVRRSARRLELVKENGQWFIKTVREIEIPPPPPLYNHLKPLDWLIGKWKDVDQNVVITFTTHWDKHKNFISQHFKMSVLGTDTLEGAQIIGWDSVEKKIRSWVFDSDGGFGSGTWTQKEDAWEVTIQYVLSDGTTGSATNIYKKINDKSYSYSSVNREVAGKKLPDVEPVTIEKE